MKKKIAVRLIIIVVWALLVDRIFQKSNDFQQEIISFFGIIIVFAIIDIVLKKLNKRK